jgi:hypothetical protein
MPLEKPQRENQPSRDSFIELAGKIPNLQQSFTARIKQYLALKTVPFQHLENCAKDSRNLCQVSATKTTPNLR